MTAYFSPVLWALNHLMDTCCAEKRAFSLDCLNPKKAYMRETSILCSHWESLPCPWACPCWETSCKVYQHKVKESISSSGVTSSGPLTFWTETAKSWPGLTPGRLRTARYGRSYPWGWAFIHRPQISAHTIRIMDTIPSAFIRFPLCFALYRDIYVDMNGGISGGGISLAFDYNEDCFRELMENDDNAFHSEHVLWQPWVCLGQFCWQGSILEHLSDFDIFIIVKFCVSICHRTVKCRLSFGVSPKSFGAAMACREFS